MIDRITQYGKRQAVVFGLHNSALMAVIVLLIAGMTLRSPYFLTFANFEVIMTGFVLEAIMAVGMTFVILSGGIDLSVSSVLPLSAILAGFMLNMGLPIVLVILITLVVATSIGFFNAFLKIVLDVHPFIATLATMLTVRGLALAMSRGENISGFSTAFTNIGQGRLFNIPYTILFFAVLIFSMGYLLKNHRFFQQVYFIGYNPKAAMLSGLKVNRFFLFVFGFSAFLAGVAGILAAAQYGAAHNSYGIGSELRVITAVAIGGTSMVRGGTGTMFGTLLGITFMAILSNAFMMSGISTYWQDIVTGVMLLLAILAAESLKGKQVAV
ncbi:MAG: ABC transporter permease [Spirochaetia bacterium]|nr:ABC transporter permease [Spirochaetia bacterium]